MLKRLFLGFLIFFIDLIVLGLIPGTPFIEIPVLIVVDFLFTKIVKAVSNHER